MSEPILWTVAGATVGAVAGSIALRKRRQRANEANDREAHAHLQGWNYQALDAGFAIAGRELGRNWEVVVSEDEVARWSTFTLGAPDIDRPSFVVCRRGALGSECVGLSHMAVGSDAFQSRFDVYAAHVCEAHRVIDELLQDMLMNWPCKGQNNTSHWLTQRMTSITAWLSPHGVRILIDRPLNAWSELQHLIKLGHALALRGGIV